MGCKYKSKGKIMKYRERSTENERNSKIKIQAFRFDIQNAMPND